MSTLIQAIPAVPIQLTLVATSVASLVQIAPLSMLAVSAAAPAPLALAFGAGVLAVFNPCGFALLPAFLSYTAGHLGGPAGDAAQDGELETALPARLWQGALLGLPLTAGFLLVFLVAGVTLAAGGRALASVFPWLGLVVGVGLILLGARLLFPGAALEVPGLARVAALVPRAGRATTPPPLTSNCCAAVPVAGAHGATVGRLLGATWGFGLGYGLSSLGCTLPVFLLVVGSAIAAGGIAQAALVFGAYASGMAVVLFGVALVATSLGDVLRQSVLPLLRWVRPVSALLILAAGIYIVVYQLRAGLLIH